MAYDSRNDTLRHIDKVREYLMRMFAEISSRGIMHDASKLEDPEKSIFDGVTPLLRDLDYGTEEYEAVLNDMGPALEHHYDHNRHHPEHFRDGVSGMTLVDLVEMFCDWCAATHRHETGNIGASIEHNAKRFAFDDVLRRIFRNTAQQYKMGNRYEEMYDNVEPF